MLLVCAIACVAVVAAQAQLVVDAGKDTLELCQGQTAQLGGSPTALGGRAPYRYQWDPPLGLSDPSSPNPIVTAIRSGIRYVLTVTDSDGQVARDTVLLIMHIPPRITAGGAIQACIGQQVLLGGTPTAYGGTPPYTYQWQGLPPGTADSATPNPKFVAERPQQLTIVLRVTDSRGCTAVDTAVVAIAQSITVMLPARVVEACAGEPVRIGNYPLADGGTAPYSIRWSPDTAINAVTIPMPTVFPMGTTVYRVTVTDAKGCYRSDSVMVRIKPAMSLRLRDTLICLGKELQLGGPDVVRGGIPPYRYRWVVTDLRGQPVRDTLDSTAAVQRVRPPASRIYTLYVTDAQGCTRRASMQVTVTESPVASFAVPPEICQGKTIIFGTGYNQLYEYHWSVEGAGGVIVGNAQSNVVQIRWDSSGQSVVTLEVRDFAKGCDYRAQATVRVHPLPQPRIAVEGRQHLCPGETTVLDAGQGFRSYLWSNGATTPRIQISDQQAGVYTVTVTDEHGCVNTSPPIEIRANTTPQPTISGPTKFCPGSQVQLSATPGFARYEWNTGATTQVITISEPGTYRVTVYDSIGCPGSSPPFTTELNPVSMDGGGNGQFLNRETLLDYPEQSVYFVNTDDEPLTLNDLRLNPPHPDLRITRLEINGRPIATVRGAVLKVGERLTIYLKYTPQKPDTAVLRLELEIALPCPWTYIQPLMLSSYDKRVTAIAKVPDVVGKVGSPVAIPVVLQLVNPEDSLVDATLVYTVRVNGRLFDFERLSAGDLLDAHIDESGWYHITVQQRGVTLKTTEPHVLTELLGTGLAASIHRDSVHIQSLEVRDVLKPPVLRIVDGVLSLAPYCFSRDVKLSEPLQLRVVPNPAYGNAEVELIGAGEGRCELVITTLEGATIWRRDVRLPAQTRVTIPLELEALPSGVYLLTATTSNGVERRLFVVTR